jgi:tripartite ATP-independent transporter DctM subunit
VSEASAALAAPGGAEGRLVGAVRTALVGLAALAVAAIIVLPAVDLFLARAFFKGLSEAGSIVDHATLVLAFATAALATLDRRHISLSGGEERPRKAWERTAGGFGDLVAVTAQTCLFWASLSLTFTGFDAAGRVWIIPIRIIAAVMPLCFGIMTALSILGAGASTRARAGADADADAGDEVGRPERIVRRSAAALGLVLGSLLAASSICNLAALASGPETNAAPAFLQALASAVQAFVGRHGLVLGLLVGLSLPFGTPIFAVLGGIAAILFVGNGAYLELAPSEAYALLRGGSISALPLFGIAGILLAESGAGKRFVAVFREFFGWFRGGEAIAAILACAVFSTFTGVNGVTIVALGGILAAALVDSGGMSGERAQGLITASGDIGLLLPPSAAVIVYGINAQFLYSSDEGFSIVSLFKGALVPGCLIVAAMCVAGVFLTPRRARGADGAGGERSFKARSALAALKPAALELLVPVAAIVLYFTGFASLREVGALSVLYIVIVEAFVKREFSFKGLFDALGKSFPIVGGTLIIIAVARGLSFYLIDANIPAIFTAWIQSVIHSKFLFLLLLNLFLLVVGCLMDIFSAILVVSPFLIPLGAAFGVPPVQFGVIFLMNLLLGFLTPPVGMNLFLSSYTFREPMPRVIRNTWPFLIVQLAVLMLVTYVPALSTILK